jgi:hypothetical protein
MAGNGKFVANPAERPLSCMIDRGRCAPVPTNRQLSTRYCRSRALVRTSGSDGSRQSSDTDCRTVSAAGIAVQSIIPASRNRPVFPSPMRHFGKTQSGTGFEKAKPAIREPAYAVTVVSQLVEKPEPQPYAPHYRPTLATRCVPACQQAGRHQAGCAKADC